MTTDELRAAAERLEASARAWLDHMDPEEGSEHEDHWRDQLAVARDWLRLNPADDGEAVTEEWLRSVGFIGSGLHKYGPGLWSPNHELRIHHDGSWSIELPRLSPKTRGDLRRLAAVLGITLNETKETRP